MFPSSPKVCFPRIPGQRRESDDMRKILPLLILPLILLAGFYGCTKERIVSGPDAGSSCIACHSSEASLKAITGEGKLQPPASKDGG